MAIRLENTETLDYGDVQADGSAGQDESLKFINDKNETVVEIVSDADGTKQLKVGDSAVQFFPNIADDGTNIVLTLPTADPEIEGALWNDTNTVKISAGPPPEE